MRANNKYCSGRSNESDLREDSCDWLEVIRIQ